jgi:hypothetical protein
VCAVSAGKAAGARRVLAQELAVRRTELRALVVCGFDTRPVEGGGAARRDGAGPAPGSAGAVFVELATSELGAGLRPVLCTGRTVALRREDLADFRPSRRTASPTAWSPSRSPGTARWSASAPARTGRRRPGCRSCRLARRRRHGGGGRHAGLLGEGWDSPSLNVVVDLTATGSPAVATAVRGRVLRRDPDRPEEVVHAWTVTCVADEHPRGGVDHLRVVSATERQLGLAEDGLVEAGVGHLDPELSPDAAPGPATARRSTSGRSPSRPRTSAPARAGPSRAAARDRPGGPARARRPSARHAGRRRPAQPAVGDPDARLPGARPAAAHAPPRPAVAAARGGGRGRERDRHGRRVGPGRRRRRLATGIVLGGAVAGQRWVAQSRALRRAPADASVAVLRQLADAVADALHAAGGAPVGAAAVRCAAAATARSSCGWTPAATPTGPCRRCSPSASRSCCCPSASPAGSCRARSCRCRTDRRRGG